MGKDDPKDTCDLWLQKKACRGKFKELMDVVWPKHRPSVDHAAGR